MTKVTLWCIGIGLLLLIFSHRIWNLRGITHTDDAVWLVAARSGQWEIIKQFAINQGRLWAFVSGTLMYISLYFHNTVMGDLLRVGMLFVFFVLFYRVITVYLGQYLALLAATFNLALYALRWEGSIVTTYPLLFWVSGSIFLSSVLLSWNFIKKGKYLYVALALFFISLFGHESGTTLFVVLYLLSIFSNCYLLQSQSASLDRLYVKSKNRRLIFGGITVILLYFSLYITWRMIFSTEYEGNTLGALNFTKMFPVLLSLSTSGSLLSDIISPYSVNFSDAVAYDGFRVTYPVFSYLESSSGGLLAWLSALVVLVVVFSILMTSQNQQKAKFGKIKTNALAGIFIGSIIAISPILPVAFSYKYQEQYYKLGIHSYVFTALSHFGVTLLLASIVIWILSRGGKIFQNLIAGVVAVSIAVLSLCGYRMNDAIVNDMSNETIRWSAVDQTATLSSLLGSEINTIYAPRLQSGSWFACVDTNYWSQYVAAFHHKQLWFHNLFPEINAENTQAAYMDFMLAHSGKQLVVFMAPLTRTQSCGSVVADRIVVSIENPSSSDFNQFILAFTDKVRGAISVRFSQLKAINKSGSIRMINDIEALPSSIRFEQHSIIQQMLIPFKPPLEMGTKILFGTSPLNEKESYSGAKMLQNGWNNIEPSGVWSSSDKAVLSFPTDGLQHGTLDIRFFIGTYVGLTGKGEMQQISVLLNDKILATRIDAAGAGFQSLNITIPKEEWSPGQNLNLILGVDHVGNPVKDDMGILDSRDLGLCLRSLEIASIKELE